MRIVLCNMPSMLSGIIRDVLHSDANCEIVAQSQSAEALPGLLSTTQADVVVLSMEDEADETYCASLLMAGRPPLRVISISSRRNYAYLHELRHQVTDIGELSAVSLLDAIFRPSPLAGHC